MNYQEKQNLITESRQALARGQSWEDFQNRLSTTDGLYPADVKKITLDVDKDLEREYRDRIDQELTQHGTVAPIGTLHPSVQERLVESRLHVVRNRLVRQLAGRMQAGATPQQLQAASTHPLVTPELLQRAMGETNHNIHKQNSAAKYSGLAVVLFAILYIVIKSLIRSSL